MSEYQESYPVGRPGVPWSEAERQEWLVLQRVQRSYSELVIAPLHAQVKRLQDSVRLTQIGTLDYSEQYPVFAVESRVLDGALPTVLITGGIHGYETSGVLGALKVIETVFERYAGQFNFIVVPCVSPWGFETINRWNPRADDPNRSFKGVGETPESVALIAYLERVVGENALKVIAHFDLHETTDTDNSEFRPALQARDAVPQAIWDIPDGFYSVDDSERPQPGFHGAIIEAVEAVTHIAEADAGGRLIGDLVEQRGVINYPKRALGLCGGVTDAAYVCTTEVYPDSPNTTPEVCIKAQVAAVVGGLDYILSA